MVNALYRIPDRQRACFIRKLRDYYHVNTKPSDPPLQVVRKSLHEFHESGLEKSLKFWKEDKDLDFLELMVKGLEVINLRNVINFYCLFTNKIKRNT